MRIAYLCDGEGCRSEFRTCQREELDALLRCRHTTDPRHAVNGPCDTPEMEPERFVELEPGVYMEKAGDCLQDDNKTGETGGEKSVSGNKPLSRARA